MKSEPEILYNNERTEHKKLHYLWEKSDFFLKKSEVKILKKSQKLFFKNYYQHFDKNDKIQKKWQNSGKYSEFGKKSKF